MVHFQESLISWYLKNKRDLPWRHTKDPYRIWLSEVILQQTRVNQGTKYYLKFIEAFPTVEDLSNASEKKVLALWQGLGYYSRARNLHAAAKDIVQNYNKEFPSNYASLIHLKGVGPYTAAAIASFSFNEAKAVLDGNVFRVLSRIYDIPTPINTPKGLREFEEASRALLNLSDPATHNQAIMEFGALVCTPKAPKCHSCPFTLECNAYKNETVLQRPVKIRKKKVRSRYFLYTVFFNKSKKIVFLKKRTSKDIWQNLYDFDLEEFSENTLFLEKVNLFSETKSIVKLQHKLTHQIIDAAFVVKKTTKSKNFKGLEAVPFDQINSFPIPTLIKNYLEKETYLNNSVLNL